MSRIVGARTTLEHHAATAMFSVPPALDTHQVRQLIDELRQAVETIRSGRDSVAPGQHKNVSRFLLNGLLHLAQAYAWLGDAAPMRAALSDISPLPQVLGQEVRDIKRMVWSQLAYARGQYRRALSLIPPDFAQKKAGEASGLRAQIIAASYRQLGRQQEFMKWCRWLVTECPEDVGNGPAVLWAKACLGPVQHTPARECVGSNTSLF
jgi:hypothetical protein